MTKEAKHMVAAMYVAISGGDVPGVLALLAPEIEWTEAEKFPYYSGTWTRPQDVVDKLLVPASKDFSKFVARADDYICEGNRVVSLGAYIATAAATGKSFRAPFAHVWEVEGDKITKFTMYTDTAIILDAFKN